MERIDPELIGQLAGICRDQQVKLSVVSPLRGRAGASPRLSEVAELPVLEYDTRDPSRSTMLIKRVFDLVVSAGALVVLAPLFPLVALAIKLDSRGPVFFKQLRAGRRGVPFRMYKLRTMVADAERALPDVVVLDDLPEPMFKLRADPRVTRVGRLLRRFSLDELPQLVNVLRGDMSIVGPRPEQVELVERYLPEHRFRLDVKPGHDRADAGLRTGRSGLQRAACGRVRLRGERVPGSRPLASSSRRFQWSCGATAPISGSPAGPAAPGVSVSERCPACGGELVAWRSATATDPQLAGRREYALARCVACGTARTELPRGAVPPGSLYEAGTYAAARPALDRLLEPLRALVERDKLRFVRDLPRGARVLEVGAGDGRFVSRLRAAGFEATGIEPSEARGPDGARPRALAWSEPRWRRLDLEPASLDAAIAWHVLEHLDDPADGAGANRRLVAPGRPRRGRLSQPGEPAGPNRRRSVVPSGRAPSPDPLHRDRAAPAARALGVPASSG